MTKYQLPPTIDEPGLLVGYSMEESHIRRPVGFSFGSDQFTPVAGYLDPYLFHGEGHLMTIAPTGAGKGVSCVIPAALRHEGDIVVMDPKGENFMVTASYRKRSGQAVYLFDPFGVTEDWGADIQIDADGLNLFDLLPFLSEDLETGAQAMAGMLVAGAKNHKDDFWDIAAQNILAGLILTYSELGQSFDRLLEELRTFPRDANKCAPEDFFPDLACVPERLRVFLEEVGLDVPTVVGILHDSQPRTPWHDERYGETLDGETLDDLIEGNAEKRLKKESASLGSSAEDPTGLDPDLLKRFHERIRIATTGKYHDGALIAELAVWAQKALSTVIEAPARAQSRLPVNYDQSDTVSYPLAILKMFAGETSLAKAVSGQCAAAPNRTFGSMLTTLGSNIAYLQGRGVRRMLSSRGFDIDRFRAGIGTSVYIVFPPHRLAGHSQLLAMLFKGLINIICSRRARPMQNTLFLMDEVAQLGYMEEFVAAKTLLRGYGVQVWSFWQDLSQLKTCYPTNWETLINNCKVFQAFGCSTPLQAMALDKLFELPTSLLLDLEEDEMLLSIFGDEPVLARKPAYYKDPAFAGLFEANPLQKSAGNLPEPDFVNVPDQRPIRASSVRRNESALRKPTAAE